MEADERMKLPEMNDVPKKKSVNVLEALAKYNLKKQQEQEQNMMDTTEDKKKQDIQDLERRLSLKSVKPTGSQQSFTRHNNMVNKQCIPKDSMLFGPTRQQSKKLNDIKRLENFKRTNFKQNKQARADNFFMKKLWMSNCSSKDFAVNQEENGTYLKHDCEVGITEFVSQCQGFSAVMGHHFFDIQVNEICLDGSIVHLTTKHSPGSSFVFKRYPTEEEQLAVCPVEQWNTIDNMVKTGKPEIVEIDVSGKGTAEKKRIRRILKMKYDDIDNNSATIDGKTIMTVFKRRKKNRQGQQQRNNWNYTQFVLYKENQTTVEALNTIAKKLKMESGCFTTAGTKDKKAITSQLVTAKNVEPHLLLKSVKYLPSISIGNFSHTEHPLRSCSLRGNRFTIALRNVIGDDSTILKNLNSLKEIGFINYHEPQRFGTRHMPTHLIGKQLLLGNWKEAINLILEPGCLNSNHLSDVSMALIEYKSSKDAQKAYGKITRSFQTIEAKLLLNLTKCGEDIVGALNAISHNIRVTYMRSYQCFIWNTIASKRLATFGLQPIIGDLVFAPCNSGSSNEDNRNVELEKKTLIEMVGDKDNCGKNGPNYHRKVIFIDENNIHKYTIHDVVLPLPGWHTVLPANQIGVWCKELLEADGLSDEDFHRSFTMFNLSGIYRFMISKPFDVTWKFVHYGDPNVSLIQSDKERMTNKSRLHPATQGGAFRGLVLEFNLSAFAFASMVIREITKMDMTAECQKKFRGIGKRSQSIETQSTPEGERRSIQLESHKSPERSTTAVAIEQTKENPEVNNQHTLATENSCIEPEFEVNGVKPGRNQNSPVPTSRVPEEPVPKTIKFESDMLSKMPPSAAPESIEVPQTKTIKEEPGISKHLTSETKDKSEDLKNVISSVFTAEGQGHPSYTTAPEKPETKIIKKEQGASEEPAAAVRHYSAQADVRMLADKCPRSEKEISESLKYPKRIKEEPDISETPPPKVGKSPEEPEKKRVKIEPVTLPDRSPITKMTIKEPKKEAIILVDVTSDQED